MARWVRSSMMGLGLGLLLAGGSCSDRHTEDEPDIEIDYLCREYCTRVMDCVWTPESNATFDDQEGCESNCRTNNTWTTTCDRIWGDMLECYIGVECPDFRYIGTEQLEGVCEQERGAWNRCLPGDPR